MKKLVQPKECYKNAFRIVDLFSSEDREIRYNEGVVFVTKYGVPIEHAFNSVNGKYFDATLELLIEFGDNEVEYSVYGDYSTKEVRRILLDKKTYGDIHQSIFRQSYEARRPEERKGRAI